MGIWTPQNLGDPISLIVQKDDAQDEAIRSFERGGTEPTSKPHGLVWSCTNTSVLSGLGFSGGEALVRWVTTGWALFADATKAQINAGGTVPFAADQSMGNHRLTNLQASGGASHAVRQDQVLLLSGTQAMAGDLDMNGNSLLADGGIDLDGAGVTNLAAPTDAADAATKGYVDSVAPKLGTASLTGSSPRTVDIALGFTPGRIKIWAEAEGTTDAAHKMTLAQWFESGSLDVNEVRKTFFVNRNSGSPTLSEVEVRVKRRGGTPVLGVTVEVLDNTFDTVRYEAYR